MEFRWTEECQQAFEEMKKYLSSSPALTIFDPKLPIHIYTDASLEGMGAILKQVQDNGEEKTVAYFSDGWEAPTTPTPPVQPTRRSIKITSYAK